jgi:hypothetical protein
MPAAPIPRRLRVLAPQAPRPERRPGQVSRRDLDFVGVDTWPISTPGWHAPTGLFLELFSDLPELSAEVSAGLRALMDIEFLG